MPSSTGSRSLYAGGAPPRPHEGDAIVFDRVTYEIGGRTILSEVSFKVAAGTTAIVLGPSGIGKSTILRLTLGLIQPKSGDIFVLGRSMVHAGKDERNDLRRRVGMVFQNGALFDSLTVGENVGYSLIEHSKMPIDQIEERVRRMLVLVGLDPAIILDGLPNELSIGMQRRTAIARALASNDPAVMLYDEPTTGLDPISVEMITDIIVRLREELHVTSVVVTHEIPHALKVGNRFLFLYDRGVVFDGTAAELASTDVPELQRFLEPFKVSLAQAFHSFSEGMRP